MNFSKKISHLKFLATRLLTPVLFSEAFTPGAARPRVEISMMVAATIETILPWPPD